MSDNNSNKESKGGPKKQFGIKALNGFYYTYGNSKQAENYQDTTEKIGHYFGQSMSEEMKKLVLEGKEAKFELPSPVDSQASFADVAQYNSEYSEVRKEARQYGKDKGKAFLIIMGQCTYSMKDAIKRDPDYETMENESNVKGLLKKIKDLAYGIEESQDPSWNRQSIMRQLFTLKMRPKEPIERYRRRFDAVVEVAENLCGSLVPTKFMSESKEVRKQERDKYLASIFLASVDRDMYKSTIDELSNKYLDGNTDAFPKSIASVQHLLVHRRGKGGNKKMEAIKDGFVNESSFHQQSSNKFANWKCFKCQQRGHIAKDCPSGDKSGDKNEKSDENEKSDDESSYKSTHSATRRWWGGK